MRRISLYHLLLLASGLLVWLLAAISPPDRLGWFLENIVVFIFVPLGILLGRLFRISNLSWTCITLFMILHIAGSHWTYAYVPLGDTVAEIVGASRNMFDRIVHFAFGLLFAYPFFEMFSRVLKERGAWAHYLSIECVLAVSALYEIFEWITARTLDAERAVSFLGSQGDFWDTQKDMACAAVGALITTLIVLVIERIRSRGLKARNG